jgi:hypothetical protein
MRKPPRGHDVRFPGANSEPTEGAPTTPPPPADIATYIAEMTSELQTLAQQARFSLLAQFLAMARVEAEMLARMSGRDDRSR